MAVFAKADGTIRNYAYSLNRRLDFGRSKSFRVFPASVVNVALFFGFLSDTVCSASVVETGYCVLKWVHELAGVPNPVANPFVKSIVEGAKRKPAKPAVKKDPIFLAIHFTRAALSINKITTLSSVGILQCPCCYTPVSLGLVKFFPLKLKM